MKTESADKLNIFMLLALGCYTEYCFKSKQDAPLMDVDKQRFHQNVFISLFNHFIKELQENIRTYKDIDLISDYVIVSFPMIIEREAFHDDENKWTIERGYEVNFLLNLKKDIEYYIYEINACAKTYVDVMNFATTLRYYFDQEKENNFNIVTAEQAKTISHISEYLPEDRFRFSEFKNEFSMLHINIEKIKLINERLFDFEQWQIQYDNLINDRDVGQYYEYSARYYNDFEKLCGIELKRLEKLIEIELRMPMNTATIPKQEIKSEQTSYSWNSTDTDLIELISAMYQNKSIARKDGKTLTRKELTDYFQGLFGIEIKDVEGKLTRATGRNDKTPFLDSLKVAFENYGLEKEEKQQKRK